MNLEERAKCRKNPKLEDLFLREASPKILLSILNNSPTYKDRIWRDADISQAGVNRVIKDFLAFGLIALNKRGRTQFIKLSEKGKIIAVALNDFYTKLKDRDSKKVAAPVSNAQ